MSLPRYDGFEVDYKRKTDQGLDIKELTANNKTLNRTVVRNGTSKGSSPSCRGSIDVSDFLPRLHEEDKKCDIDPCKRNPQRRDSACGPMVEHNTTVRHFQADSVWNEISVPCRIGRYPPIQDSEDNEQKRGKMQVSQMVWPLDPKVVIDHGSKKQKY